MKKILTLLFLFTTAALSLTTFANPAHEHGHHQHGGAMPEKKGAMGKGVIHSVSRMNRKVNLTHAPIPELGWPEMKMDLDVAKGVNLKGLSSGQEIQFYIELGDDKVYRITEIMKKEHGAMHEGQHGHGHKSH